MGNVVQFDAKSNGAIDHIALVEELLRTEGAQEFEKAMAAAAESTAETYPKTTDTAKPVQEPAIREMVFGLNMPNAKEIYLVGDFNHWKINDESRLSKLNEGRWEKKLQLSSGRYKYKFVVDGEWVLDSQNTEREPNTFGTFDSIIKL